MTEGRVDKVSSHCQKGFPFCLVLCGDDVGQFWGTEGPASGSRNYVVQVGRDGRVG